MAYQLPVASQSDSDLASLSDFWFEMPSPVSSPARPNPSPKTKTSTGDPNGSQPPADNSGFRPGLPTNHSKGPNSPTPKGTSSNSTSPASSSLQPNRQPLLSSSSNQGTNSPPRRRTSLADPSTLQTFYNNPPPPRLQTDLSSLHLLPQLTTQPSPTTTSSPASPGFRGLGRSPTRHNPSNSHSSFFQDPSVVAPSPTTLPQQQQHPQPHQSSVPGGGGKRFVPTMSDAAKLDRSRTLVRNLMGPSAASLRRNDGQRDRSPNGENEARGSARSGSGTPSYQQYGYSMENGRSRTVSQNHQSSLPSPSLARPNEGGAGGGRETTIAAPSSLPTSPPSQVQSFESFVGSDGELRKVLIDGRLFQFDSTGTRLMLIDHPPPPTTQVVSPPPADIALPLTPAPVTAIEPPTPSTSAPSPASSSAFSPPPKPTNLTIDPSIHIPPTNGRASQAFYGDLLGDLGASPTVEAHPDRVRSTIMGSRLAEDLEEEEPWQQQSTRNEGAELAQQQLQQQQNQQQKHQQQQPSSKRGGFIEPRLVAGEGERKKIVSSAEQLRTLEAKYGIEPRHQSPPQPKPTVLPTEPQPPPKPQAAPTPPPLEPRFQSQPRLPFQPQSPPRHQTSPSTSSVGGDSRTSSPTKPSFPPLETKFSSSSIHNPTSPPNAQPSLPHAHPHHPPFQVTDSPSTHSPPPPPPPEVKEPPPVAAPSPSRTAPPPQRVISPISSDDDYSDDDATPLAFTAKPRPPALPPKDAQALSSSSAGPSSQSNQIPRRPAREQPPSNRASTEEWVVPSPVEGPSSSGRPTDPYEVLSRPMPRELDTGGRFGEKLKRGVTGLRKELKKGMTQVQALRPNAPTSPSSPLNALSSTSHHPSGPNHSHSHSNPHPHSQQPQLHTRTNSSEPNKHQSPTDHQQHGALPPRPLSPMREALAPQSMTGSQVAARAGLIEDEEERKLAENMFM